MKNLRIQWEESQSGWNDSVRRDFEDNHLKELEARVASALGAIERLAQVLGQARGDCE